MTFAVLGSHGQLGRDLVPRLKGKVVTLTRADIDLANPATVAEALRAHRPDVFINCAAYNFVDRAEAEPEAAFAVNAFGVRTLAQACASAGVKLVHFSTDYVFGLDESRAEPWVESSVPGPVSVYGQSKLAGEHFVRAASPHNLVIRTCGLYGVWGSGGKGGKFVETMLRLAREGKPLRVVADQLCTPSFTADVATATIELLERGMEGLVHLTNSGDCSWHEFAAEIFRQSQLTVYPTPIPSQEYPTPARRPRYSVLKSERLAAHGVAPLRPWQEALSDYLRERTARPPG